MRQRLSRIALAFALAGSALAADQHPLTGGGHYVFVGPAAPVAGRTYDLVIALHGMGDTAGNFATVLSTMLPKGREWLIAAPEGSVAAGPGFSWDLKDTGRVLATATEVVKTWSVTRGHVFLVGFSAGGHIGWATLAKAPTTFSGYACLAQGLSNGIADDKALAAAAAVPIYLGIGAKDPNHALFQTTSAKLAKLGFRVRAEDPDIGHTLVATEIASAVEHWASKPGQNADKPGGTGTRK